MKRQHIRASTLVETLAAMMIIVIALTAGFMIYRNVMKSHNHALRLEARSKVDAYLAGAKKDELFEEFHRMEDGVELQSRIAAYRSAHDLITVTVTAKDQHGEIIYTQHELVYVHEN
jgi:hypothetical protein